jgi:hypothetical protein
MKCEWLEIYDHWIMVADCSTDDPEKIMSKVKGSMSAAVCAAANSHRCPKRKNKGKVDRNCW